MSIRIDISLLFPNCAYILSYSRFVNKFGVFAGRLFDFDFAVCSFLQLNRIAETEKSMSLFFSLLRILAEENLEDIDEEEILEMLESEDWKEIEQLIEWKAENSERTLH